MTTNQNSLAPLISEETQARIKPPKRGTIAYEVRKLAKRYGYSQGIYILEQALLQATKAQSLSIDGQPSFYSTKGWAEVQAEEKRITDGLKAKGAI